MQEAFARSKADPSMIVDTLTHYLPVLMLHCWSIVTAF